MSLRKSNLGRIAIACLGVLAHAGNAQPALALTPVVELPRLVDLCAERLGLDIEYDQRLSGTVVLRLGSELTDAELWDLTNRVLAGQGHTTVRMSGRDVLSVVSLNTASQLARVESADATQGAGLEPGFRVVRVALINRDPDEAVAALKPLLSETGGFVEVIPGLKEILIGDLAPRLESLLLTLQAFDAREISHLPAELPLAHIPADQAVTLLAQIEAKRETTRSHPLVGKVLPGPNGDSLLVIAPTDELATWTALRDLVDREESPVSVTYGPFSVSAQQVADSVSQLIHDTTTPPVVDESTRTFHLDAPPSTHARVSEFLTRIDAGPEGPVRASRTFRLQNRDASEVLSVLQSISAGAPIDGGSGLETETEAQGRATQPAHGDGLSLTVDPGTNAIIAIGTRAEIDRVDELIDQLDVRRSQVLLEVLIVSLSDSDSLDLGLEIEKLIDGPNNTIAKLSSLFGLSATGAGASSIDDRGAGGTAIVLNPGDFSVVIRALQSLNQGRSLSIPQVLVSSNEEATLNSVLEQPYTELNASDTVATTSFGGTSDAGTEVSVTPQIAEGDHLRLEYQISLSTFVGDSTDPSIPPPRQQNSIGSVATIPDGFTIAVGGIELTSEGYSESGIPFLSDVPVLGEAFKNRSKSNTRSRFYVFIRPTILRDRGFEDLKYLSDLQSRNFSIDDDWPEPQPRIIR